MPADARASGAIRPPRDGAIGDADAITALEAHFPGDRLSKRSIRHLLRSPSARVLVIDQDNSVVAAIIVLTRAGSRTARIYSLAVAPTARGQGLARRLVRAAEQQALRGGARRMSLEVRQDNEAAQALYQALGYGIGETLPAYYDDGSNGLRLQRLL